MSPLTFGAWSIWNGARRRAGRGDFVGTVRVRCRSGTAAVLTIFSAHDERRVERVNRKEE
jgi:hypothetical protein